MKGLVSNFVVEPYQTTPQQCIHREDQPVSLGTLVVESRPRSIKDIDRVIQRVLVLQIHAA